ncbi:MAG: hypothetical protein JXQ90_19510 [Cyclobacteriaceae bacterium]
MSTHTHISSPPWRLKGKGYIFVYSFSKHKLDSHFTSLDYLGGLTLLMLVDYSESNIGPYHEMLLIPGKSRFNGITGYHISHIHVSTEISTINGRANWGIPKTTLPFQVDEGLRNWRIGDSSDVQVRPTSLQLPVFTHFLPYQLIQQLNETVYKLRPSAWGTAGLAKLDNFNSDLPGFELLNNEKPLIGLYANKFHLTFPNPKTFKA